MAEKLHFNYKKAVKKRLLRYEMRAALNQQKGKIKQP